MMVPTACEMGAAIEPLLAEGKRRARALGRPLVVSLTHPLPGSHHPLSIFAAGSRVSEVRSYWGRPAEAFWLVGVGEAMTLKVETFGEAIGAQQDLTDTAVAEGSQSCIPHMEFVAGFRFDPGSGHDREWNEFTTGLLTLHEWTFSQRSGVCRVTVNTVVGPETDTRHLHIALQRRAAGLFGRVEADGLPAAALLEDTAGAERWRTGVNCALEFIRTGRLAKVVLARTLRVRSQKRILPEAVIEHLTGDYPQCRIFAFNRGETCFLGATPEELVSKQRDGISAVCMAGSVRRGIDEKEDMLLSERLFSGEKERREHALVSEWVSKRIGLLCDSFSRDEVPRVARLGNVQHLVTSFAGTVQQDRHVLEFVEALHPTPAVAGVPVELALQTIREVEGFDRGWYGGPVGWVDGKDGEFGVALRCALVKDNEAVLYAGAGIVAGSEPDEEYQETAMKFRPLLAALGAQ